ncbi:unnamed protein product, partial [Didymodactylos carnosus]
KHVDDCHTRYECEYCDEKFLSLNLVDAHKKNGCSKALAKCVLKNYGCIDKFIRSERGNHLKSEQHQQSVLVMLEKLRQFLNTVTNSTQPLITTMNSSVSSFKTIREEHIEQNLSMDFESGDTAPSSSRINDLRVEFQKYDDILNTLTQGVQTLSNDINRLSTESLSLTSLIQAKYEELNQLKKIRLESDNRIAAIGPIQESLQQELSNVKENIESTEFTTHD